MQVYHIQICYPAAGVFFAVETVLQGQKQGQKLPVVSNSVSQSPPLMPLFQCCRRVFCGGDGASEAETAAAPQQRRPAAAGGDTVWCPVLLTERGALLLCSHCWPSCTGTPALVVGCTTATQPQVCGVAHFQPARPHSAALHTTVTAS